MGGESMGHSRGLALHLAFNAGLEQAAREVAAKYAAEHGMHVIMDRCMRKEYDRLLG